MRPSDIPAGTQFFDELTSSAPEHFANGGSAVAGPDGKWILEPQVEKRVFTLLSWTMPVCAKKDKIWILLGTIPVLISRN